MSEFTADQDSEGLLCLVKALNYYPNKTTKCLQELEIARCLDARLGFYQRMSFHPFLGISFL